ncbi:ferritin family protein [Bacillus mesophilum]|uniref:Ferritin-like domain-containing protein n=1 Tax=Bacillus mesophilum TaxID=1071718 RepID=A0A7V7RQW3_9BACI|nr:ferritin-like domain-containing protein [Bacillus mesophilum]KAB2335900.1 ferritin-like domain-containing protein [Bacillus mesophilum]
MYYLIPYAGGFYQSDGAPSVPFSIRNNLNTTLKTDIEKALDGEYSAIYCYEILEKLATSSYDKSVIREIRKDEESHYNVFSSIYFNLTKQHYQPKITESCPNTYHEGLVSAFKDEQNTVDFYLKISDKTSDQIIKNQFNRIAKDEQNHAVWFLYLMNRGN